MPFLNSRRSFSDRRRARFGRDSASAWHEGIPEISDRIACKQAPTGRMSMPHSPWVSLAVLIASIFVAANATLVAETAAPATLFIREYRVEGAKRLPRISVEAAVYPYLGPGRTRDDVERARAALEEAYHDAGFQTVAVRIPAQTGEHGVVHLQVVEIPVGRLRVRGARYSSLEQIKSMAPSVQEGRVIDFNEVPKDLAALNQLPDRQVTPSLKAGVEPDTVDVDLEVKETLPVHAGLELDNRNAANTTPLRLNGNFSANNLGQSGNSLGLSFQESPQKPSQVRVFSAYYLSRFKGADWLSLMVQGMKQDSNVSTLGDVAVAGRGQKLGLHAIINLPPEKDFTQSVSVGIDYKHFDQNVAVGGGTVATPITYYPIGATYTANWQGSHSSTEANADVTFHLRGMGDRSSDFNTNRYNADSNFVYLHGDLSRTQDLPGGFQIYGKAQGQISDQPLVNSDEQITGGGLGTVRGYYEAEEVGDNGLFGTIEFRSPSFLRLTGAKKGDWRIYVFADAGWLTVINSLPDQKNHFDFASYGFGSRLLLADHFDGLINVSFPQLREGQTKANDARVTFKAGLDY
jgi:hemolysin activation/secretion protein